LSSWAQVPSGRCGAALPDGRTLRVQGVGVGPALGGAVRPERTVP